MKEPFHIFRMTAEDVDVIANSVNDPHRHDFEELLIGMEGQLEHFIDFSHSLLDAPFVSFVTQGKVHKLQPRLRNGQCDIWVLRFQTDFIPETTFQLYMCFHEHANLPLPSDSCFNRFVLLCEMMHAETLEPAPDYAVIRHLLSALFTMLESERQKLLGDGDLRAAQGASFKEFLKLLDEHFRKPLSVEFYADKLHMTSRNLNLICQNILQQSVSEIIENRRITEAKNLLSSTDLSISEIGFELGYKEKAYFSNVFRKKAGQTPTEFRKSMKEMLS